MIDDRDLQVFRDAGFDVSYDAPDDPRDGEGWIDLKVNGNIVSSVSYKPGIGFGIYFEEPEEILYGQRPDMICADASLAVRSLMNELTDYNWHPHEG